MADLYVPCPRCEGTKQIYAWTKLPDRYDGGGGRGEYFDCPLCHATGEADAERAAEWTEREALEDDDG